jgi:Rieske Fe-S protein
MIGGRVFGHTVAAKKGLDTARHYVGDRIGAIGGDSVEDIPAGSGRILSLGGRPCAVYRDDHGKTSAVSAEGTHRGCLVAFNDTEKTWECPCHRSRFATDGTILDGPVNRPLPRHNGDDQ